MALRREQLYMVKAQAPQDTTTTAAADQYFGGSPLELTASGAKLLKPSVVGDEGVRKFLGVAVNSWTEDNKYGQLTAYIVGPCVLALYDGAASPFVAGPGDYPGPGMYPKTGAEVYGPYGLGTGLTTGEGQPYVDGTAYVPGGEITIDANGLYKPTSTSTHYTVGKIKSIVDPLGTTLAPVIVEIQFTAGVTLIP